MERCGASGIEVWMLPNTAGEASPPPRETKDFRISILAEDKGIGLDLMGYYSSGLGKSLLSF